MAAASSRYHHAKSQNSFNKAKETGEPYNTKIAGEANELSLEFRKGNARTEN